MEEFKDWGDNFQTPEKICKYQKSLLILMKINDNK